MKTIEDNEGLIDFDQQQAIKKYMAMLKRRQNAPQVFKYPSSKKSHAGQSEQDFLKLFTHEFETLNQLKNVPVVFWQPATDKPALITEAHTMPIKTETKEQPAIKQTQDMAINRSLSVLHAMLGITAPTECATIAQIDVPVVQVAKEAKKPAKARKIASITQPADIVKHQHDVWFYLLGKDKNKQKSVAA